MWVHFAEGIYNGGSVATSDTALNEKHHQIHKLVFSRTSKRSDYLCEMLSLLVEDCILASLLQQYHSGLPRDVDAARDPQYAKRATALYEQIYNAGYQPALSDLIKELPDAANSNGLRQFFRQLVQRFLKESA